MQLHRHYTFGVLMVRSITMPTNIIEYPSAPLYFATWVGYPIIVAFRFYGWAR